MLESCRVWRTVLAGLAALLLAPAAQAQQLSFNTAVLGAPPALLPPGYHFPISPVYTFTPTVIPVPFPAYPAPLGFGGFPGFVGLGPLGGAGVGYGAMLTGMANLTQATGQYWVDIQRASLAREGVRQAALDTARQRLEFEAWYENFRDTAPRMRAREMQTDLDRARANPPMTEIWSGRMPNILLRSILASPTPTEGPHLSLDPSVVRRLNLTDGSTRGTLALVRDEGKIAWTEALEDAAFDQPRDRFAKNFEKAVRAASSGEVPDRATVRDLREDLAKLDEMLIERASAIVPSRFIEARRLLNNLRDNIRGLSDARLIRASNSSWYRNIHTVAELVEHLQRNGLQLGPASASGDEEAYTAVFHALRAYERELVYSLTARR